MKKGWIIGILVVLLIVVLVVIFYNKPAIEEDKNNLNNNQENSMLSTQKVKEIIKPSITEYCDFLENQSNSSYCPICRKIPKYDPTTEELYEYYVYVNYSDFNTTELSYSVLYSYEKDGDNYNVYVKILTALGGRGDRSGYQNGSFVLDNAGNIVTKNIVPPPCQS